MIRDFFGVIPRTGEFKWSSCPARGFNPRMSGQEDGNLSELQWLCRSVLRDAFPDFRNADIDACFLSLYRFDAHDSAQGSRVDAYGSAITVATHPGRCWKSIILILGCKVMRRRPRQEYLRTYELFGGIPGSKRRCASGACRKGRKHLGGEAGRHHSLEKIYRELNGIHFNNQIEIARIGWGLRRSRKRMGHYDPAHHTITLSPVLDAPGVPEYVVQYIVYHEMLHAVFENAPARGRRRHHYCRIQACRRGFPSTLQVQRSFSGNIAAGSADPSAERIARPAVPANGQDTDLFYRKLN